MQRSIMKSSQVANLGQALYEGGIRDIVETEENIGRMIIIDVETGEYAIDPTGHASADALHAKRPDAALYGIKIGYNASESVGGVVERIAR